MDYQDNRYLDLTTYPEIYRELVYQRNSAIRWLQEYKMVKRDRRVLKSDKNEWGRHTMAMSFRSVFRENIIDLIDRLYPHDARDAQFDFEFIDLGDWSDTEVNRLELETQRLQLIIGKLEQRYHLQYQLIATFNAGQGTLYINNSEVFTSGLSTLRNRLLITLFSQPKILWQNQAIEDYFIKNFGYQEGQLTDKKIEKAASDIRKDVAARAAAKDFLIVSNSAVRINPFYL